MSHTGVSAPRVEFHSAVIQGIPTATCTKGHLKLHRENESSVMSASQCPFEPQVFANCFIILPHLLRHMYRYIRFLPNPALSVAHTNARDAHVAFTHTCMNHRPTLEGGYALSTCNRAHHICMPHARDTNE